MCLCFPGAPEEVENSKGSKDDLDLDSVGSEENDGVGPVLQVSASETEIFSCCIKQKYETKMGKMTIFFFMLQFDYSAIADHLFELGSHLNTRNINRKRMYSLVKT